MRPIPTQRVVTSFLCAAFVLVCASIQPASAQLHPDPFAGPPVVDASDQVEAVLDHPLTLAEPAQIPLRIHSAGLSIVQVAQVQYLDKSSRTPDFVDGGRETSVPILNSADGTPYITITPLRLGKLYLDLSGGFPGRRIVFKQIELDVVPGQKRPEKMSVGENGRDNFRTRLSMTDGWEPLWIYVTYEGIPVPIKIDASYVSFRVVSGDQGDPIRLDHTTGRLTPLHPGQALVQTSFGGLTNWTCVNVGPVNPQQVSRATWDCQQLLPPGQKLGPVK
jgi:hypothetical protein